MGPKVWRCLSQKTQCPCNESTKRIIYPKAPQTCSFGFWFFKSSLAPILRTQDCFKFYFMILVFITNFEFRFSKFVNAGQSRGSVISPFCTTNLWWFPPLGRCLLSIAGSKQVVQCCLTASGWVLCWELFIRVAKLIQKNYSPFIKICGSYNHH